MVELSEPQEQGMARLYDHGKGLPLIQISKQMNIPYSRVYTCLRLKERGFDSISKYLNFRAEKNNYRNSCEYDKDRIKKKHGQTPHQRKNYLAQKLGFKSRYERNKIRDLEKRLGEEGKKLSLEEKRGILKQKKIKKKIKK